MIHGKNFAEVSKNLARYESENNFVWNCQNNYVGCLGWLLEGKLFAVLLIMLEIST